MVVAARSSAERAPPPAEDRVPRATTLSDALGITVQRYVCRCGPADPAFTEARTAHTISLIQHGAFTCVHDGVRHGVFAGNLLIGRPGDEVRVGHDDTVGDGGLTFRFTPDALEQAAAAAGLGGVGAPAFFTSTVLPPAPRVAALAAMAERRAAVAGDAEWPVFAAELAVAVLVAEGAPRDATEARPSPIARRRVREAVRLLEEGDAVDIPGLAAAVGLSPFHFIRVFRAETGTTPLQYQVRVRLLRAIGLLAGTDAPVSEVALRAGFGDLAHFQRTFRAAVGRTPGDVRRGARGA